VHQPEGMREMAVQESPAQPQGTVATSGGNTSVAVRERSSGGEPEGIRGGNGKASNGRSGNGKVSKRDSDEIVADIERTRQNLALTIDTLADRVNPASQARRLREQMSGEARQLREHASGQARQLRQQAPGQMSRPEVQLAVAAVGLAVVGIVVYRIWGRRRS
jgi:hypothetical protein